MQFKLSKTYFYWWPVTVFIPDPENAGQFLEQELKVQFEAQPRDLELAEAEAVASTRKTVRELAELEIGRFKRAIKNWDGVLGEDGKPVPFSAEYLEAALQFPWFREGVTKAYTDSLSKGPRSGN